MDEFFHLFQSVFQIHQPGWVALLAPEDPFMGLCLLFMFSSISISKMCGFWGGLLQVSQANPAKKDR